MFGEKKGHIVVSGKGEIKIPLDFKATHFKADFDDEQPECDMPTCSHPQPDSIEACISSEHDHHHHGNRRYVLHIQWDVNGTRKIKWHAKAPY